MWSRPVNPAEDSSDGKGVRRKPAHNRAQFQRTGHQPRLFVGDQQTPGYVAA